MSLLFVTLDEIQQQSTDGHLTFTLFVSLFTISHGYRINENSVICLEITAWKCHILNNMSPSSNLIARYAFKFLQFVVLVTEDNVIVQRYAQKNPEN